MTDDAAFAVTEHEHDDGRRLLLRGELDATSEPVLRARLDAHADGPLVLDLTELGFLDSGGIRLLVAADAYARRDGWELTIAVAPDGPVTEALRISGLDQMLPVRHQRPAA